MEPNEQTDPKPFDYEAMLRQAVNIRDAIAAKSISARQVGELFCAIILACADADRTLANFLAADFPKVLRELDHRFKINATKIDTNRAMIDALDARFDTPLRVDIISAPRTVTLTNPVRQQIHAKLFPPSAHGAPLCMGDHRALEVSPDGFITPLRPGRSYVNAVATSDTSVYGTVCIDVVPSRCRLTASGALRIDAAGNIRLT